MLRGNGDQGVPAELRVQQERAAAEWHMALSNEHFRSDRNFLGPNQLGTGFTYRSNWVLNGVSNEHSRSDRVFEVFIVRWIRSDDP